MGSCFGSRFGGRKLGTVDENAGIEAIVRNPAENESQARNKDDCYLHDAKSQNEVKI